MHRLANISFGTLLAQGEVATARAEANEMKIRAKEADEMVKLEKTRRESEEKLRQDATEREKKVNKRQGLLVHTHTLMHAPIHTEKYSCWCGACAL